MSSFLVSKEDVKNFFNVPRTQYATGNLFCIFGTAGNY